MIEFAYFNPEAIIGKSLKYDLNSEAGYKFERGTDPDQINYAIRRFIKIVQDHVPIKSLSLFNENNTSSKLRSVEYNLNKIFGNNRFKTVSVVLTFFPLVKPHL